MNHFGFDPVGDDVWAAVPSLLPLKEEARKPLWKQMMEWKESPLRDTDPALQNLEVARGIPELADLDPRPYCEALDQQAAHFSRWLPEAEKEFHANPEDWGNDLVEFRLGMLCQFIEQVMGIDYNEEQKGLGKITYERSGDLFLHGVMDTRRGTCGNMATLYYALCWRLKWPVSIAMVGWHEICRYEDGTRTINVETSNIGRGIFRTPPDEKYIDEDRLPVDRVRSGSDLKALSPRQVLGCFFGNRGRYWYDQSCILGAVEDYGRAAALFPESWLWREKWTHARTLANGTASST